MLSATVRVTRDLDLAEECVQDAYAQALTQWQNDGVPSKPGAWLTTVARRRALDLVRREATGRRLLPLLIEPEGEPDIADEFPDDRLRLIFICCHPALPPEAQIALTLRLVCGLRTPEVARAFLVSEPTMAARITRAKKKIAQARIPFRLPADDQLEERLTAVLEVVHLVFTAGHTAPEGADLVRRDLVERALDLTRLLRQMLPTRTDVAGLLALILLTDARRDTRLDDEGRLILLADQDRSRWDRAAITEGVILVREALRRRPPPRYALQAAIAAVHAEAVRFEDTDWHEVAALYGVLASMWPSPVVALNRAVALGMADGPDKGLVELDALAADPQLAGYAYLPAARAEFLRRLGRYGEARLAYAEALVLTGNEVERAHLAGKLHELS